MTERAISYLLLLAATVAVLLVVVIQPRNTLMQKQRMMQGTNPNLAQACMMGNMTCDEYQAMLCNSQGGTWNSTTQSCTPLSTTCPNGSCTAETCAQMGYGWNGTSCIIPSSGSGSSGGVAAIGGVSANEQLAQRIESQCLAHVEKSGYGETVRKYGWYNNIRIYANNACTYAYLATNGKYSSNNDLSLIANLITNDTAVRQEDIGMLYQALEDVPAQSKEQSLEDYLNPLKDGAAKRLKDIMDIMAAYNDLTTDQKASPSWLAEPMPWTTIDAAAKWNPQHGTKIVSLEEKLFDLLPKEKLRGVWHLDESMGTSIDSSENRNHLTQVKGTPVYSVTGKFNTALQFNGNSKRFINDNEQINLGITGPLTIDAWIYRTAPTTAQEGIITKWNEAGDNRSYALTINEANHLTLHLSDAAQIETSIIGDTAIPSNTWVHVAGVYDGSSMYVFQNGIIVGKKAYTKGIANKNASVSISGAEKLGGGDAFFNGKIDEARISGDALWVNNFTLETEPEPKIIEEKVDPVEILAVKAVEPEATYLSQRVATLLTKIVNKLKGIREQGIETGIVRTTVTRDIEKELQNGLKIKRMIDAFEACRNDDDLCAN